MDQSQNFKISSDQFERHHHFYNDDVAIQRGNILIYRVFDIAEEIDLSLVEKIISQTTLSEKSRLGFSRGSRHNIVVRNAPIRLNLGDVPLVIEGNQETAEIFATLWDYGVLSIVFQLKIPTSTTWKKLISKASKIDLDWKTGEQIDTISRQKSKEVSHLIRSALKHPSEWNVFEDYVIYFLEEISGISKAIDLLKKVDIPALVLAEAKESLSEKSHFGILDHSFQYTEQDLVVIDWNSAVVYEPSGNRDITDVVEFALAHLLEFRYYDDFLDRRLSTLYDAIEVKRHGFLKSDFWKISKEANTRFIEVSEFIERVDNSLKVVGDFYLAVIFRAAIRRFRIPDWQQSITRKMNLLARVSELLLSEVNVLRGHGLELIIILLITFEVFSAIIKNG